MNVVKTGLLIAALCGLTGTAAAEVLAQDDFSYADGTLSSRPGSPWTAFSSAGTSPVQVSNQEITLVQGSGSREDVGISLGDAMSAGETWYAGFDVNVDGASTTVYFAMFSDATANNARGRLYVTSAAVLGFRFGVSDSGSLGANSATWGSDLSYNQTYRVVVAYDYDTSTTRLWVNPTSEVDTSVTTIVDAGYGSFGVNQFSFRQTTGASTQVIDNLIVSTSFSEAVPEPGSLALLGLGGLLACRRRR